METQHSSEQTVNRPPSIYTGESTDSLAAMSAQNEGQLVLLPGPSRGSHSHANNRNNGRRRAYQVVGLVLAKAPESVLVLLADLVFVSEGESCMGEARR